jgi:hypothetical protein
LSSTKESDFQLNSSYDNLNKLSNNTYIKDVNLQTKTKDFIINECNNNRSLLKKSNNFLKLPGTPKNINNIKSNYFEKWNTTQKCGNSEGEFYQNSNQINFKNTFNKTIIRPFNEGNKFCKLKTKKDKSPHFSNKNFDIQNSQKSSSSKGLLKLKSLKMTNIFNTNKFKKKFMTKKSLNLNKKLNVISKNIKNMSNSINNPNEFYMNFFNNILQKENHSEYEEEKEGKFFKKNYSPINKLKTVLSANENDKMVNEFDDGKNKSN